MSSNIKTSGQVTDHPLDDAPLSVFHKSSRLARRDH
jgi:hypothetical protein